MKAFNLDRGLIVTTDQEDKLGSVDVVPAWKWLAGQSPDNTRP
jgi:hypothetical protein